MGIETRKQSTSYYVNRQQAHAFIETKLSEGAVDVHWLVWQISRQFGFTEKFVRQYLQTLVAAGHAVELETDKFCTRGYAKQLKKEASKQ